MRSTALSATEAPKNLRARAGAKRLPCQMRTSPVTTGGETRGGGDLLLKGFFLGGWDGGGGGVMWRKKGDVVGKLGFDYLIILDVFFVFGSKKKVQSIR